MYFALFVKLCGGLKKMKMQIQNLTTEVDRPITRPKKVNF